MDITIEDKLAALSDVDLKKTLQALRYSGSTSDLSAVVEKEAKRRGIKAS